MVGNKEDLIELAGSIPGHNNQSIGCLMSKYQKKARDLGNSGLWKRRSEYSYQNWEPAFDAIRSSSDASINDSSVIEYLYTKEGADWRDELFGTSAADKAAKNFNTARSYAFYIFLQPISVLTLDNASYPGTYRYKDIERLFSATDDAHNPDRVAGRVQATARIMLLLLYGCVEMTARYTRSIFGGFALGYLHQIHLQRSPFKEGYHHYFNQGGLAWTLLTFSYLVAKEWKFKQSQDSEWAYDLDETLWYRFWAIIGSSLGIDRSLLPLSHSDAGALWRLFVNAGLAEAKDLDSDESEIMKAYEDKRSPNFGEYVKLASWIPSYAWNQMFHPLSWSAFWMLWARAGLSWLWQKRPRFFG